jgi:hypothetical protein
MAHFTRKYLACAAAALCSSVAGADALHGFCSDCSGSSEMGMSAAGPLADFGFWDAGKSNSGTYFLDILIPDNGGSAPSGKYTISGGASATADLFSPVAWTGGKLDSYLGIHASPSNPLSAWLHATRSLDPKAMGYWIFQANLGMNELGTSSGTGPLLKLSSTLPAGSVVVAFLETSSSRGASASDASRSGQGNDRDQGKGDDDNQDHGDDNTQRKGDDHDNGDGNNHGHAQNNNSYTATANGSALFAMASGSSTGQPAPQTGEGGATIGGHGIPEPDTIALLLTALLGFGMTLLPRRTLLASRCQPDGRLDRKRPAEVTGPREGGRGLR